MALEVKLMVTLEGGHVSRGDTKRNSLVIEISLYLDEGDDYNIHMLSRAVRLCTSQY